MRFNRRRSSPATVALLAVAMQAAAFLVLAHVHPHTHTHAPDAARIWAKGVAVAVECRAVVERPGCPPAIPHESREDCQLCWSFAAAGAAVLTQQAPAQIFVASSPQLSARIESRLAAGALASFNARAPPHAS